MSRIGINLAVTEDGAQYNKLRRPADYIESLTSKASPIPPKVGDDLKVPKATTVSKRKHEEYSDDGSGSGSEQSNKRLREGTGKEPLWERRNREATITRSYDMDYGMQSQFPSAGYTSDEDTHAAFAYLNSVRAEASTIPQLLKAPPQDIKDGEMDRSMYDDSRGDMTILYEDGTFIARDIESPPRSRHKPGDTSAELDIQEQYYRSLLRRFNSFRKKLAAATPEALANSTKAHPTNLDTPRMPKNRHDWLYTLDREYPTPALVCQLQRHHILKGIEYCAKSLDRFEVVSKEKSCWIWALLAKAGDVGTMDYTEVGRIRDLGHKAGQFSMRLRNGATPQQESDDEDEDIEDWDADGVYEESESEGKGAEPSKNHDEDKKPNREHIQKSHPPATVSEPTKLQESSTDNIAENRIINQEGNTDSGSAMSMSEDGKVREDDAPETLEAARACLIAQLGDRLVQPRNLTAAATNDETENTVSTAHDDRCLTGAQSDSAWNTLVTVDMILTVVSTCYGQKDLLRFRNIWGNE